MRNANNLRFLSIYLFFVSFFLCFAARDEFLSWKLLLSITDHNRTDIHLQFDINNFDELRNRYQKKKKNSLWVLIDLIGVRNKFDLYQLKCDQFDAVSRLHFVKVPVIFVYYYFGMVLITTFLWSIESTVKLPLFSFNLKH